MKNRVLLLPILFLLALTPAARAQSRRDRGGNLAGTFDYYVLALSWAPTWCEQDVSRMSSAECAPAKQIGFIVHGFWPEAVSGKNPEFCGRADRVPQSSIKVALPLMLSASLIQHEWAAHGTCSGLNPYDYFTAMLQARSSVQIPVQLNSSPDPLNLSPSEIGAQFAAANGGFPKDAFRVACLRGMLEEVRVCFDKNLKPRACTASVSECHDSKVSIPPTL